MLATDGNLCNPQTHKSSASYLHTQLHPLYNNGDASTQHNQMPSPSMSQSCELRNTPPCVSLLQSIINHYGQSDFEDGNLAKTALAQLLPWMRPSETPLSLPESGATPSPRAWNVLSNDEWRRSRIRGRRARSDHISRYMCMIAETDVTISSLRRPHRPERFPVRVRNQ